MTYKRKHSTGFPFLPRAQTSITSCATIESSAAATMRSAACGKQGGRAPGQNFFGADLTKQQGAELTAWFSPSM